MKIPLRVPCTKCKKEDWVFINLDETSFERKCECGDIYSGIFGNDVTIGYKILWRSQFELNKRKDFSLSIVFSATAFECELSRLHFKWSEVNALEKCNQISDQELEELLRKYRSIDVKIEEVCKLMDPRGFKQFVIDSPDLNEIVQKGFPSLRLSELTKDFQQKLFWPRNRVLHLADTSFTKDDAARCFQIAALGLRILEELDTNRRNAS